jgi:hypothetical protein
MFPKILRMRFDAVERCCVAALALVAMEINRLVCQNRMREKTQKAAFSALGKPQLQRPMNPRPIYSCDALRDGASFPERLG